MPKSFGKSNNGIKANKLKFTMFLSLCYYLQKYITPGWYKSKNVTYHSISVLDDKISLLLLLMT